MSTTSAEQGTPVLADDAAERLAAWMDGRGLGAGAPLEHRYISGGSQNEIYEIRRGDLHCALLHLTVIDEPRFGGLIFAITI